MEIWYQITQRWRGCHFLVLLLYLVSWEALKAIGKDGMNRTLSEDSLMVDIDEPREGLTVSVLFGSGVRWLVSSMPRALVQGALSIPLQTSILGWLRRACWLYCQGVWGRAKYVNWSLYCDQYQASNLLAVNFSAGFEHYDMISWF